MREYDAEEKRNNVTEVENEDAARKDTTMPEVTGERHGSDTMSN